MVTKDEALKLALEALTATMSTHGFQKHIDQAKDDAITAIKQSLAAPVQDTEAHYKSVIEGVQKLFDEKRAQPAPVQEPTVWTATRLWNRRGLWTCPADIERTCWRATPPHPQHLCSKQRQRSHPQHSQPIR